MPIKYFKRFTACLMLAVAVMSLGVVEVYASAPAPTPQNLTNGTGKWCNPGNFHIICISADGKRGHLVYGRQIGHSANVNRAENFRFHGAFICRHAGRPTDLVQSKGFHGDTTNCPMRASLDNVWRGVEIQLLQNVHSGFCVNVALRHGVSSLRQGNCSTGAGRLWLGLPFKSVNGQLSEQSASVLALERNLSSGQFLSSNGRGRPLTLLNPTAKITMWKRLK